MLGMKCDCVSDEVGIVQSQEFVTETRILAEMNIENCRKIYL